MRTICIERAPRIGHHRYPTRTIRLFDSISSVNSHMECTAFVKGVPVFLAGDSFEAWLDGSAGVEFLRPAPENLLHVWPVSKRVNRSGTGGDDFHPYRSHRQLILPETFGFKSGIFDQVKNHIRRFE